MDRGIFRGITGNVLVLAGYAVSSLARPLIVVATTPLAVLAIRFADRVGKGIRTSPRDALIADSVDVGLRHLTGTTAPSALAHCRPASSSAYSGSVRAPRSPSAAKQPLPVLRVGS